MIQTGILNPEVLELIARIRHTNTLVIADWAFPYWTEIEVVDIALTRGIPKVTDLLELLAPNFKIDHVWQAEEFLGTNPKEVITQFDAAFGAFKGLNPDLEVTRLPHIQFKALVPQAIGLIRTGDATAYGNVILRSC